LKNRGSIPFHLILEEAHRYIQADHDRFLFGYNIFERIAKEGRKYGVILGIITQRPVELSDNVISQCTNFLIFKINHPVDVEYIRKMVPNITDEIIEKQKSLQSGTCLGFGLGFKIPLIVRMKMPDPSPLSGNCDVVNIWNGDGSAIAAPPAPTPEISTGISLNTPSASSVPEVSAAAPVVEPTPAASETRTNSIMPSFVELTLDESENDGSNLPSDNIIAPEMVPSLAPEATDNAASVSPAPAVSAAPATTAAVTETSAPAENKESSQPSLIDFAAEPVPTASEPVVTATTEVASVPEVASQPTVVASVAPEVTATETIQPISEIAEVNLNSQGMLQTDDAPAAPVISNVPAPAAVLDLTDDDDDASGFEPDFS
jgi:hypothetical protein